MVYSDHLEHILMLAAVDNNFAVLIEFGKLITEFIFKACIAFLVIAAADYGVTKWKFLKDQKMSFKEIKDENGVKTIKRLFFVQKCEDNTLKNVSVVDFSNKKTIQVIQSQYGKTSPAGWQFNRGAVYTMNKDEKILNTLNMYYIARTV